MKASPSHHRLLIQGQSSHPQQDSLLPSVHISSSSSHAGGLGVSGKGATTSSTGGSNLSAPRLSIIGGAPPSLSISTSSPPPLHPASPPPPILSSGGNNRAGSPSATNNLGWNNAATNSRDRKTSFMTTPGGRGDLAPRQSIFAGTIVPPQLIGLSSGGSMHAVSPNQSKRGSRVGSAATSGGLLPASINSSSGSTGRTSPSLHHQHHSHHHNHHASPGGHSPAHPHSSLAYTSTMAATAFVAAGNTHAATHPKSRSPSPTMQHGRLKKGKHHNKQQQRSVTIEVEPESEPVQMTAAQRRRAAREKQRQAITFKPPPLILRQSTPTARSLAVDPTLTPLVVLVGLSNGICGAFDVFMKEILRLSSDATSHEYPVRSTSISVDGIFLSQSEDGVRVYNPNHVLTEEEKMNARAANIPPTAFTFPIKSSNSTPFGTDDEMNREEGNMSLNATLSQQSQLNRNRSKRTFDDRGKLVEDEYDDVRIISSLHSIQGASMHASINTYLLPSITSAHMLPNGRIFTTDSDGIMKLYSEQSTMFRLICAQRCNSVSDPNNSRPIQASAFYPLDFSTTETMFVLTAQESELKMWRCTVPLDTENDINLIDGTTDMAFRLEHSMKLDTNVVANPSPTHNSAASPIHNTAATSGGSGPNSVSSSPQLSSTSLLGGTAPSSPAGAASALSISTAQHRTTINCLLVVPETSTSRAMVLCGMDDRTIRVIDLESFNTKFSFHGHLNSITCLIESNDHHRIISGSLDSNLKLWSLETGRCDLTLRGHTGPVSALANTWHPQQILSSSLDGTIRLWNIGSGGCDLLWTLPKGLSATSITLMPVFNPERENLGIENVAEMDAIRALIAAESTSPLHSYQSLSRKAASTGNNSFSFMQPITSPSHAASKPSFSSAATAFNTKEASTDDSKSALVGSPQVEHRHNLNDARIEQNRSSAPEINVSITGFATGLTPSSTVLGLSPEQKLKDELIRERTMKVFQSKDVNEETPKSPAVVDDAAEEKIADISSSQTLSPPLVRGPWFTVEHSPSRKRDTLSPPRAAVVDSPPSEVVQEEESQTQTTSPAPAPASNAISTTESPTKRLFDSSSAIARARAFVPLGVEETESEKQKREELQQLQMDIRATNSPARLSNPGAARLTPHISELDAFSPDSLTRNIEEKERIARMKARTDIQRTSSLFEPTVRVHAARSGTLFRDPPPAAAAPEAPTANDTSPIRNFSYQLPSRWGLQSSFSEPQFGIGNKGPSFGNSKRPISEFKSPPKRKGDRIPAKEAERRNQVIQGMIARIANPLPARGASHQITYVHPHSGLHYSIPSSTSVSSNSGASSTSNSGGDRNRPLTKHVLHHPSVTPSPNRFRTGSKNTQQQNDSSFFLTQDGEDADEDEYDDDFEDVHLSPAASKKKSALQKSASAPGLHFGSPAGKGISSKGVAATPQPRNPTSLSAQKRYVLTTLLPPPPPGMFKGALYSHLVGAKLNPRTGGLIFPKKGWDERLGSYLDEKEAPNVFNGFQQQPSRQSSPTKQAPGKGTTQGRSRASASPPPPAGRTRTTNEMPRSRSLPPHLTRLSATVKHNETIAQKARERNETAKARAELKKKKVQEEKAELERKKKARLSTRPAISTSLFPQRYTNALATTASMPSLAEANAEAARRRRSEWQTQMATSPTRNKKSSNVHVRLQEQIMARMQAEKDGNPSPPRKPRRSSHSPLKRSGKSNAGKDLKRVDSNKELKRAGSKEVNRPPSIVAPRATSPNPMSQSPHSPNVASPFSVSQPFTRSNTLAALHSGFLRDIDTPEDSECDSDIVDDAAAAKLRAQKKKALFHRQKTASSGAQKM